MDNKYSIYRDIRYKRTFRTIGKMSWWRIVLGIVLIVFVVFLSGLPSQMLASREEFQLAEKMMISPEWMEKYKPETKAFIEAGVLYQDGKLEEALAAFEQIEDFDAAGVMKNRCMLAMASRNFDSASFDDAYNAIVSVDFSLLDIDEAGLFLGICDGLLEYYGDAEGEQADALRELVSANS